MNSPLLFQRSVTYLIYGIVTTIPLLFGAVHPIVQGCYVYIILTGLGSWLLLNHRPGSLPLPSIWAVVPALLIAYLSLQSIPLPLDWVEMLSPQRAARVRAVNELAGTGLQNVSLNENGPAGFYRSFFLFSMMLYYYSLKRLIGDNKNFQKTLLYCLVGVGTFEALYGLVQFINPQIGILWLPTPGRAAHGTIIYKNQYASMLNLIWPMALASGVLAYAVRRKTGREQSLGRRLMAAVDDLSTANTLTPLMMFAAGMMILAVLFSLSRGGILAMGLVGFLLLVMLPFRRSGKIAGLSVFLCLLGAYVALLGFDTIASRFDTLDSSGANRLSLYLASLPMLWDHWLTGIGMGSYALLSPVYLKGFPASTLFDRVHNEYLELIIELGVPAAVLLFTWIFAGMTKLLAGFVWGKREIDLERQVIGAAAFCGLVGFLVHGFADFGWRLPANLVYCATLLAMCVCSMQSPFANEPIERSGR